MKEKICIFAGTSEGRALAEGLNGAYSLTVCVATDYGKSLLEGIDGIDVVAGRMGRAEMESFIRENGFSRVIDATHPYAAEASENIRAAALFAMSSWVMPDGIKVSSFLDTMYDPLYDDSRKK